MTCSGLLEKLVDIERSIGVDTDTVIRCKVQDAQVSLLRMQGELVERLRTEAEKNSPRFSVLRSFSVRKGSQLEF